jgi:hypothetical protein
MDSKYKLTLGVGSLAVTAMLAELCQKELSFWVVLVITILPLMVFVFVHPGELPAGFVRIAHTVASVWYLVVAIGLLVVLMTVLEPLPQGWPFYPVFVGIGGIPCVIVLYRMMRGRYSPPADVGSGGTELSAALTAAPLLANSEVSGEFADAASELARFSDFS